MVETHLKRRTTIALIPLALIETSLLDAFCMHARNGWEDKTDLYLSAGNCLPNCSLH
jgi:hypothetical protein